MLTARRVGVALTCAGIMLATGGVVFAQSGFANQLVLVLTPANPKPNSEVMVEVKTTAYDLGRSTIGWLENGELVESGVGKTQHTLTVGKTGSSKEVTVVVQTPDNGQTYEKSATIHPAEVVLIWESPSTVPPFYRGKALYPQLGTLVVTAIPEMVDSDGQRIATKNLVYTWKKNSEVLGSLSGYGRSTLTISDPIFRTPFDISVEAESKDGAYLADGSVSIDTADTLTLTYENSPLYGILFNKPLSDNFRMVGQETTLETFPYFFHAKDRNSLAYHWTINGADTKDFTGPYLTVRNVSGQTGTALVSLDVSNENNPLEGSAASFNINFGGESQ